MSGRDGELRTHREDLDEYLREQRDEAHSMHKDAETDHGESYAHGRYHAFVEVLVWLIQNWEDERK